MGSAQATVLRCGARFPAAQRRVRSPRGPRAHEPRSRGALVRDPEAHGPQGRGSGGKFRGSAPMTVLRRGPLGPALWGRFVSLVDIQWRPPLPRRCISVGKAGLAQLVVALVS